MVSFKPLIDLKPTKIKTAFLLNAIVTTVITVLTIHIKKYIDEHQTTKDYSEWKKIIFHMGITFFLTIFVFIISRYILGYGGGMLSSGTYKTFF